MTHLRSLRLTHTKNTICHRARNWASNIIHAEGVRVVLPSSAPKARNALMSQQGTAGRGEMIDRRKAEGPRREAFARGQESGLPANRALPNQGGWWVTFGEQSRSISRECRRIRPLAQEPPH